MSAPTLLISRRLERRRAPDARLVLPYDLRSRSRFRTRLDSGEPVGIIIARGQVLRGGDLLLAEDGRVIEVVAAPEIVTTARTRDPGAVAESETLTTARTADRGSLARAAYHLGNRHVPVQLNAHWLRYRHDHVLDDMVRGLGLHLTIEEQPFEPEGGAYRAPGHAHGPDHAHDAHAD